MNEVRAFDKLDAHHCDGWRIDSERTACPISSRQFQCAFNQSTTGTNAVPQRTGQQAAARNCGQQATASREKKTASKGRTSKSSSASTNVRVRSRMDCPNRCDTACGEFARSTAVESFGSRSSPPLLSPSPPSPSSSLPVRCRCHISVPFAPHEGVNSITRRRRRRRRRRQ